MRFSFPVTREHVDQSREAPTEVLELGVPVIPARGSKEWTRTVLVDHERRSELKDTVATVTFTTPDAGIVTTQWPASRSVKVPARRLRRRLKHLASD
jgi:hypothetical protein